LSGKYRSGAKPPKDSRATNKEMGGFISWLMSDDVLNRVEQLRPLAAEAGCSMAQFALAWVLREPNVSAAIIGATRPEQVSDNAKSSGLIIDPALFAQAEAIVAGQ
jgi:1-deoxyxylulose-5-phosphate synthase